MAVSRMLAAVLSAIGLVLTAWNWYLQPGRSAAWASAAGVLGGMAIALAVAVRRSRRDPVWQRAADGIAQGVVFGALILSWSLGTKLAVALGGLDAGDLAPRVAMVLTGIFFVVSGNALPKTLTPLATLRCDPGRVQSSQRLAGWTLVLMGLVLAGASTVLPLDALTPIMVVLMMSSAGVLVAHCVRMRRTPRKEMHI